MTLSASTMALNGKRMKFRQKHQHLPIGRRRIPAKLDTVKPNFAGIDELNEARRRQYCEDGRPAALHSRR